MLHEGTINQQIKTPDTVRQHCVYFKEDRL